MKRGLLAAVLAGALALAGCGIPDNTRVEKIKEGPTTGFASGDNDAPDRFTREDATDNLELVQYYLRAAAASNPETSLKQVQSFLSPSANNVFKAPSEIKVVHLTDDPLVNPGSDDVTLKVVTVGVLTSKGILEPSQDSGEQTYKLTVSQITGKPGLFVTKAPQVMLLTDRALQDYYEPRTIYFWNKDHTALVPDVRYLSADVPSEQVPGQVIKWLIDGPAAWLADSVESLPEGTLLQGNVPAAGNGKLQISLSGQAVQPQDDPNALDRLRRQVMWSLQDLLPRVLELTIGQDQNDYEGTDYLLSNASYRLPAEPERFVIYNQQIRRLSQSRGSTEAVPVVRSAANKNVRAAAIGHSFSNYRYAALVTAEKGVNTLRVGGAAPGEQAGLKPVALRGGSVGQPVWAITSDDAQTGALGLITVGGKLFSFSADGSPLRAVAWPGSNGGFISAVAVAPDGRRLALVAGDKLYVAALDADGDVPELSAPRLVQVFQLNQVTAVDWGTETSLVVAGVTARGRASIIETEIDGTRSSQVLADIGTQHVTYLTSYPVSPVPVKQLPDVIHYMANGITFDALTPPVRIGVGNLADPVTNPPAGVVPVAPFFLR
ncbi:LpqB family beta-propeller domain-containing protein [Actinoplanes sp. TFC3]|uniref:LpqB family beta-propeller domain-containing protein n=1 Tax=Actinoplanes sp. TFC3 TaxID=1710355 RepID=UPI00082BE7E9|nr:LpqB family beta-propeller domain-containing protein [Actinoplanes sp. TFC3]